MNIEDKTFIYQRAKNASGHVFLGKTGSITNSESSPLGEILSFTINYDVITNSNVKAQNTNGFGYLKYRVSNNYIDNVNDYSIDIKTIGRDYTVSFGSDYPSYLSFYTPREVVINSLSITYKDVAYERVDGDFDIQVFATNDIHGQVKETSSYPGLSKLTNKMKSVASTKDQYNIFMDQGDIYQGTAEAGLANGLNMGIDEFGNSAGSGVEKVRKPKKRYRYTIINSYGKKENGTQLIKEVSIMKFMTLSCSQEIVCMHWEDTWKKYMEASL